MSLRIIYGRTGSGKTTFCLNEIKSRIIGGPDQALVLLVPEQSTFQMERELINMLGTGGLLRNEVLSFRRVAFRVFNEAGGLTYPHIHPSGKCMVIYRILDNMKDRFKVFSRSADRKGFVNTISDLITEFKRYDVTPEDIENAAAGLDDGSPLKDKLAELNTVYMAFDRIIAERYTDADDDLTLACEKLGSTSLYEGAEIWVDGFSGFTPQEYKLIGRLLQRARRVNITLCTDSVGSGGEDWTDIFRPVKETFSRLLGIASESGAKTEPPVFLDGELLPRFAGSPELAHLEDNYNKHPFRVYKGKTKDISLFSSVSVYSEVEEAARSITALCRDRGMRWRDIAVVAGDLDSYGRLIEVIFTEYGIPCFIDRKTDIIGHPLAILVMSILDIFIENWSYEAVLRYLKTGLTGVDRNGIDRLENYVLACGIRGGKWTENRDWDMSPELVPSGMESGTDGESLAEINKKRYEVTMPLLEFRKRTRGRRTASEICGALYDLLCETGVPKRIETAMEHFKNSGELSLANEYGQVWNIMMEVFDQTVEVMGEDTFGIERFSNILRVGLAEYQIGLIPASLDQVLVGSVERSRSHGVKAMFIIGANEGMFPAPAAAEGVLSDPDRAALANAGIELAGDTRTRAFDGQYHVYRALTAAGCRLRISWSISDNDGRSMRPAVVISRIRRLFPAVSESSNVAEPASEQEDIDMVTGGLPAFRQMVSAVRRKADGEQIRHVWTEVYRWFAAQPDWQDKCRLMRSALLYRNDAQPVSRDSAAALYGNPAISSVSRLEKYSSCPFAYFVQYGLNARDRRVYRLKPPDVGTFMHAVIERFSRMTAEEDISWREFDREWCNRKISGIIDDMLSNMKGSGISGSKRYTMLAVRLKRVVARAVWMIAEHIRRSSFDPVGYEMDFGQSGKFPPITIELDSGVSIRLIGRIDRVDAFKTEEGTYLRIVDYKSGNKNFRLSDVFYGLQIQLITYMDAILDAYGRKADTEEGSKRICPGGMLYFHIDDPMIRGSGRATEEEIERAIMRQLKMKGLLLADVKLIKEMDNTMDGASLIIPARINKGDVLGKSSAASPEQFKLLRAYVRKLLKGLCGEIMKGNVSIRPYKKKGATPCSYCSYSSVCQFDAAVGDNTFKLLYDRDDGEIWQLMEKEGRS